MQNYEKTKKNNNQKINETNVAADGNDVWVKANKRYKVTRWNCYQNQSKPTIIIIIIY